MEKSMEFPHLVFEEGYYTLPQAIQKIAETFGLSLNNKESRDYKTIYQRLRREMEAVNLDGTEHIRKNSQRKTEYSSVILNVVVSKKLYIWLCRMAEKIDRTEFEDWKKRVKRYGEPYGEIMTLEELKNRPVDVSEMVESEFQRRKHAIAMDFLLDYIFSECIELNEKLLREDIEYDLCLDEDTISERDLMVNERLQNHKNYYTVKKRPALFKRT